MKIKDVTYLYESFKDAKAKFSTHEDPEVVDQYLKRFRAYSNKGIVQGPDKDIGKWIKAGWEVFKSYVESLSGTQSKSEIKKAKKKDSITVYEDDQKIVVIPLTKDASCFYGKSTEWCTTSTGLKNNFAYYFYEKSRTLFYVIMKNGSKFAATIEQSDYGDTKYMFFDEHDEDMNEQAFVDQTSVTTHDLDKWYSEHKSVIEKHRDFDSLSEQQQKQLLLQDPTILKHVSTPSDEVMEDVLKEHGFYIMKEKLIGEPSEKLKKVLASYHPDTIGVMQRYNFSVDEEIYALAIEHDPHAIRFVHNPSEKLQMLAVKNDLTSAKYLAKPTQSVQDFIISKKKVSAISALIDKFSDESVIKISEWFWPIVSDRDHVPEKAQLNAVRLSDEALGEINSPTESAKKLHAELWG